jgi:hypothetical protein
VSWSKAKYRRYKREWNRRNRGCVGGAIGRPKDRKSILGVNVKPNWMPIPAVSKEQATQEFLEITKDMA